MAGISGTLLGARGEIAVDIRASTFEKDEALCITSLCVRGGSNRHPEEPRACAASRRIATTLVAHPSRLAVKNGEHLRMTAVLYGQS
jgi:hypothetical protein